MRLIPISEVVNLTSLGRSTIYRYIKDKRFPKQVNLGIKNSAWVEAEIFEWIEERVRARDES